MSDIPPRLYLSPAESWKFASRAASLFIRGAYKDTPKGFLSNVGGYEIYLDENAPKENPDWEIAQQLLEKLGA